MTALYRPGDLVILTWPKNPAYDGEYVVHAVYYDGDMAADGRRVKTGDGKPCYYLGFEAEGDYLALWGQKLLKKRHDPASESYVEMMTKYKSKLSIRGL